MSCGQRRHEDEDESKPPKKETQHMEFIFDDTIHDLRVIPLYSRPGPKYDQDVYVYDWERDLWLPATQRESYQPRFRVPVSPELNIVETLGNALKVTEKAPRECKFLLIVVMDDALNGSKYNVRIGFAASPEPFEGQKVQTGQQANPLYEATA